MKGKHLSHYLIESELGRGGMGIVYRARDTKLDRTVAIKVLPSAALASEDDRARFYREAKAAAQLHHPHIASVFEIDEAVPEGAPHGTEASPFIAMEFIEGQSLEARIKEGLLKIDEAVGLAIQIASGIETAHEKDIVHRDIKAANIMLTAKGEAKILDFGLAQTAASTKLTRMGSTLGTVAYMSPEQARGEPVDVRTDIWSLGAVIYEMVTGQHPFPGDYEQAVVYSILNQDPEPLTAVRTGVPMELERITNKLLAKDRGRRYQSTTDLLVDLRSLEVGSPRESRISTVHSAAQSTVHSAVQEAAPGTEQATTRRMSVLYLLIAVGAGLAIGAALMFLNTPAQSEPPVLEVDVVLDGIYGASFPEMSPDDRYLAFVGVDSTSMTPTLRIYDFESGITTTVPNSDNASWPQFSPDGKRIAFFSLSDDQTKIAVLPNQPAVAIDDGDVQDQMVWDAHGNLYYTGKGNVLEVMRVDGAKEILISPDSIVWGYFPLDYLNSSDRLLAMKILRPIQNWTLVARDLASDKENLILDQGVWNARYVETGHLIFLSNSPGPLNALAFSADRLETTGIPIPVLNNTTREGWSVSEKGHLLRVSQSQGIVSELIAVGQDGGMETLYTQDLKFYEIRFSRSGSRVASQIHSPEFGYQTVLIDLASSTFVPLIPNGITTDPSWSPDESEIALTASSETGGENIVIVRADRQGSPRQLTFHAGSVRGTEWSPDGDHILYHLSEPGRENERDIWQFSFSDSTSRPLIVSEGYQSYPRYSPDGDFIAYVSNEGGRNEVHVMNASTEIKSPVTNGGGDYPSWSNEADRIYFRRAGSLYSIPVDTTDGFRVTGAERLEMEVGPDFFYDVLDDGRIAVARSSSSSESVVEITLNWTQRLLQTGSGSE